ncbi:MAG TPA: hypothetical protein VLK88_04140 [Gemmatimonadales bacterium]|nr:hypothetical protein [Gemmatimonadales bacterium]
MSTPATPQRIAVTIDGHAWTQVSDLSHSAPDETHFTVAAHPDGSSEVVFGDGRHGRVPPRGSTITYRLGEGGGAGSVSLSRTNVEPTPDTPLWVVIRGATGGLSFGAGEYGPGANAASTLKWRLVAAALAAGMLGLTWWCYLHYA